MIDVLTVNLCVLLFGASLTAALLGVPFPYSVLVGVLTAVLLLLLEARSAWKRRAQLPGADAVRWYTFKVDRP